MIRSLKDFHNKHKGDKIVVCGCGVSLKTFEPFHKDFITIGVNDVPMLFNPTYIVVTDHITRFYGKRKDFVSSSKCDAFFTCVKGWRHEKLVFFDLGGRELKYLDDPTKLDHFMNSPYVAINLAYKMGAKYIGVVGVDFTNGHFYNKEDGAHPLVKIPQHFKKVNSAYQSLRMELEKRGTFLFNLSQESKVEIPKITIEEFKELC